LSSNDQKFTTYQRDDANGEAGLDYAMARYYASRSGRFMTPDPGHVGAFLEDPQSWNAYAYSRNDPVNFVDPSGTEYMVCPLNEGCYSPGGFITSDTGFNGFLAMGAYHMDGNTLYGDDSVPLYFYFRTSIDGIDLKVSESTVANRYLDESVDVIRERQTQGQFSEQCHATLKTMGTSMDAILSALDKRRWFDGTVSGDNYFFRSTTIRIPVG
jgi:RHS repeat-associated protein